MTPYSLHRSWPVPSSCKLSTCLDTYGFAVIFGKTYEGYLSFEGLVTAYAVQGSGIP